MKIERKCPVLPNVVLSKMAIYFQEAFKSEFKSKKVHVTLNRTLFKLGPRAAVSNPVANRLMWR